MANRYWVGGTGTWNATNTTNWSETSGGAGGASVPTSADDVFLDANSGTAPYTVTAYDNNGSIASRMCRNLDCTGFTGTLNTDSKIEVYGSLTLNSTMSLSGANGIYNFHFKSTTTGNTVQPGGNSAQGRLVFNGVGGEWSLQGAVSVGGSNGGLQVLAGTLITNGYSMFIGREGISSTGTAVRSLQLGASTITISSGNFNISGSNVTVTHTGTLTCGAFSGATFAGGGGSYGNVTLQVVAFDENIFISGANTFQNLTIGGSPLNTIFYDNQTITGTFTCNGSGSGANSTTQWRLVKICSAISGDAAKDMNPDAPQRTISASTFSVNYATFQNIAFTGTGAPKSGIFGDAGNNSGITFPAAKTVYARNTTSGNLYTTVRWSTTSGGTADVATIPLAHDTIVLDANTGTGSLTMPGGSYGTGFDIGTINASNYSGTLPFPSDNNFYLRIHGNVTIGNTATVTGTLQFYGINSVNFSSGSNISACNIRKKNGISVTLLSNIVSTGTLTHISGTFNLNNYNYSTTVYSSNSSVVRRLELGSGSLLVTGNATTVINIPNQTNFSWSGTGAVNLNYSGATGTRTITFGSTAANSDAYSMPIAISAGSDIVAITSQSNFTHFPNTVGFTGTYSVSRINIHGNKFFSVF